MYLYVHVYVNYMYVLDKGVSMKFVMAVIVICVLSMKNGKSNFQLLQKIQIREMRILSLLPVLRKLVSIIPCRGFSVYILIFCRFTRDERSLFLAKLKGNCGDIILGIILTSKTNDPQSTRVSTDIY
jgi:hypothetical protein